MTLAIFPLDECTVSTTEPLLKKKKVMITHHCMYMMNSAQNLRNADVSTQIAVSVAIVAKMGR